MNPVIAGIFIGLFSSIIFFNFLWFIYNKERAYLYYVGMQASILLIFLHENAFINIPSALFGTTAIFFAFLFTKEFLNLKYYFKTLNQKLLEIGMFISAFMLLLFLMDILEVLLYIPYSLIFLSFVFIGINVYEKGFEFAKYFAIAWSIFFITIFVGDLNRILDLNIYHMEYISMFGNTSEALILSLALFAKTKQAFKDKKKQEEIIIHKARLSSMGEMLNSIAHQWRQPLNRISAMQMNIYSHLEDDIQKEYIETKLFKIDEQLKYMSNTIDDFSNFFRKDKKKNSFKISQAIKNSANIIEASLKEYNINLQIDIKEDFKLDTYEKELSQVILNLLQNSMDALILNDIKKPYIKIVSQNNSITIEDNAKGIKKEILDSIFNPYFTTKEDSKGTGIGLYICKIIVENNLNGKISVKNSDEGACFSIEFNSKK